MPSLKRNLRILATFAALSLLALAAGCRGFFVNPTLTSMTVAPTSASIIQGGTQQINATGNYNDGSTKDLTGGATWTTSASAIATVSKGGLVTAASTISNPPGTATITATCTSTPNPAAGQTVVFTAQGTYSGSAQQQDITTLVTWSSSNTAVISTIASGSGAVLSTATSGATTDVTATLNGITSNALTITVQ